jgi:hypothetical protein
MRGEIANLRHSFSVEGKQDSMGRNDDVTSGSAALAAFCDPALEAFFRVPDRFGADSTWWGHVPFAAWLVGAARPRSIVELGCFSGVSYFAFCQAVLAEQLPCACHAVDTWQGDLHSGHYGASIYEDFKRFNDAHYAGISTVHRCTFDEALPRFANASVDILHIDGLHTYDAVRHDFEGWLPKLSPRGVVLFHDTVERRGGFGVWRLWEDVSVQWPSFQFLHSHALGVLAVGPEAPAAVLDLCGSDAARTGLLRARFGLIGDGWYAQAQRNELERRRQALEHQLAAAEAAVAAIRASASGRLTGLLRHAKSTFRRMFAMSN